MHDFVIPELGRAAPYGVYDIAGNAGWVSVGIDHDTAGFRSPMPSDAGGRLMGPERYSNATQPADHRRRFEPMVQSIRNWVGQAECDAGSRGKVDDGGTRGAEPAQT